MIPRNKRHRWATGLASATVAFGLATTIASAGPFNWTVPAPVLWTVQYANTVVSAHYTDGNGSLSSTARNVVASTTSYQHGTSVWDAAGTITQETNLYGIIRGTCTGVGRPKNAKYSGFRCKLHFDAAHTGQYAFAIIPHTDTFWMRPWGTAGSGSLLKPTSLRAQAVCFSERNLAMCPPPMPAKGLPRDPRICGGGSESDPLICMDSAAQIASHTDGQSSGCVATSLFVYHCSWGFPPPNTLGQHSDTVTFTPSTTGWKTTVSPTMNTP